MKKRGGTKSGNKSQGKEEPNWGRKRRGRKCQLIYFLGEEKRQTKGREGKREDRLTKTSRAKRRKRGGFRKEENPARWWGRIMRSSPSVRAGEGEGLVRERGRASGRQKTRSIEKGEVSREEARRLKGGGNRTTEGKGIISLTQRTRWIIAAGALKGGKSGRKKGVGGGYYREKKKNFTNARNVEKGQRRGRIERKKPE